jgi:hypothetical protein
VQSIHTAEVREALVRNSNVTLTPTATAFRLAGFLAVAAGVAWILIDDIRRGDPLTASAATPAEIARPVLQR